MGDPVWGAYATRLNNNDGFERPRNGRKNDKAHPPIHPVQYAGGLQGDEKRVYEFIVRRYLACCSRNATGAETVVEIKIAGEEFTAKGENGPRVRDSSAETIYLQVSSYISGIILTSTSMTGGMGTSYRASKRASALCLPCAKCWRDRPLDRIS